MEAEGPFAGRVADEFARAKICRDGRPIRRGEVFGFERVINVWDGWLL